MQEFVYRVDNASSSSHKVIPSLEEDDGFTTGYHWDTDSLWPNNYLNGSMGFLEGRNSFSGVNTRFINILLLSTISHILYYVDQA